jgi:hypothetical protein
MWQSLFILNLIIILTDQQLFDDVLFEIQNQNRFNPFLYGPPPIFHVKIFLHPFLYTCDF